MGGIFGGIPIGGMCCCGGGTICGIIFGGIIASKRNKMNLVGVRSVSNWNTHYALGGGMFILMCGGGTICGPGVNSLMPDGTHPTLSLFHCCSCVGS